ncbi:MAG: hypothetical protein BAA04_01705 [Firmicutes bacterium ZCTH02-B6]|nr:MAG: hypothetical protein BAA04_01705 [Firmicutes bacterium ZCTH02-B6]
MRTTTRTRALILIGVIALFFSLAMAGPAHAGEWAGSITVMWEWPEGPNRVRIWALDYSYSEDLFFTLLLENNPRRGDVLDVSATYYWPFISGVYASVGYRVGLSWGTASFPYVAVTFRFPGGGRP